MHTLPRDIPDVPYIGGLFQGETVPLSCFLDSIPVGAFILDADRRLVSINRTMESLVGFSAQEIVGIPCHSVLRARACQKACPVSALGSSTEAVSVETDIIDGQRQVVPVRITASVIRNLSGDLLGFLEVVQDLRGMGDRGEASPAAFAFGSIIGKSPEMEKIFRILPVLAETDSSVLITGETGTGKDVIAEAIHHNSDRARGPFIKVNCGALPENLLESELFGHTKGSFTGAVDSRPGRFRMANNGTLYLTEIGDLPLPLQVKLLTFLDDKTVYPIGSSRGYRVDVRVIAATHRDLEKMVAEGLFRKDLFFRLNVVRLHLPALRERGEDVILLLDHFLRLFSKKLNKEITGFSREALAKLRQYPYPGNVRELRNIVEYAVNLCNSKKISSKDLPPYLFEPLQDMFSQPTEGPSQGLLSNTKTRGGLDYVGADNWSDIEKKMILDALVKAKGRRHEAARLLGWARSTLWRKMRHYKIQ